MEDAGIKARGFCASGGLRGSASKSSETLRRYGARQGWVVGDESEGGIEMKWDYGSR